MSLLHCRNFHLVRGYAYGLRSSALRFLLASDADGDALLAARVDAILATIADSGGGVRGSASSSASNPDAAALILDLMEALYRVTRLPIRQRGRAMRIIGEGTSVLVMLPTMPALADITVRILNMLTSEDDLALQVSIDALLADIRANIPGGANGLHFMNAALDKGIPFDSLGGDVLQFGQGAKARLLEGSFTDATSRVGAAMARNKLMTSAVLRQHGIPVAASVAASDAGTAEAAAAAIGYPVVVKPANLDGGVGVYAGLKTPDQVRKAAESALSLSPALMVEKWVEGRDYRLVVFEGRLVWAIERVPGGVTGNGQMTVSDLMDEYNRNPLRGHAPHQPLKPLRLDVEALELLHEQGMSVQSVPPADHFVRMRRAANIAMGGLARAVIDDVHPDNRLLAERAASALGIDLAGIDLLIPDIGRSWLETGGVICEVNAQPDIGYSTSAHLYPQLLDALLHGNGRIPVILVVGDRAGCPTAHAIAVAIGRLGVSTGLADGSSVMLDGVCIAKGGASIYDDTQVLQRNRQVGCAIICINDCSLLDTGLAFDACDILVLAGDALWGAEAPVAEIRQAIVRAVAPSCQRAAFIPPDGPDIDPASLQRFNRTLRVEKPASLESLTQGIIQAVAGRAPVQQDF